MIRILLISPYDGWAVCQKDDTYLLVRPPYLSSNTIRISKNDVKNFAEQIGFVECSKDQEVSNFKELVDRLNNEIEVCRNGISHASGTEIGLELVKVLDADQIEQLAAHVEKVLIPECKFEIAHSVILAILEAPEARKNYAIYEKVMSQLRSLAKARQIMSQRLSGVLEPNRVAPMAVLRYGADNLKDFVGRLQKNSSLMAFE